MIFEVDEERLDYERRHRPPAAHMPEDEYFRWALATEAPTEWVAGEVVLKPQAEWPAGGIAGAIRASLDVFARHRGLGQVRGPQFTMRLPEKPSLREPDVMFVAAAHLSRFSDVLLNGPCDVAIEVVTRASVVRDYREKFLEYEAAGISEYWIVDPAHHTIDANRLDEAGRYVPIDADAERRLRSSAILGWWLSADELFREPTPTALDLMRSLGVA